MMNSSVLIVEDEQVIAMDLEDTLQNLGYIVAGIASDGPTAILQALSRHPDIILMDIRLRGTMDGVSAATEIRHQYDVPIIFLTAYSDTETRQRAAKTMPYGYLVKPFDERTLQATVEMALIRHRTDRRIQANEQWFRSTLACLSEGIITTDSSAGVTYLNDAATQLLQTTSNQCIGKHITTVMPLYDIHTEQLMKHPVLNALDHYPDTTVLTFNEAQLVLNDEQYITIDYQATAIHLKPDTTLGAVIIFRDSTDRRRMEEERMALQHQRDELHYLSRLRVMTGGLAHDVNNLLTSAMGHIDLALLDLDERHPARGHIEQVMTIAEQLANFTTQMMAYAGQSKVVTSWVQLNAIITETIASLRISALSNIELAVSLDSQLPSFQGDTIQIRQIVMNLLVNAAEAITNGHGLIKISTSTRKLSSDFASMTEIELPTITYVVLEIQDNGKGIDEETRLHMFDPFFTTKATGRGLGLATVLGNVREHHGTISIDSTPEQGTTFTILLPLLSESVYQVPALT